MPITRLSLRDISYECHAKLGGDSQTVQDLGTTTANVIARMSSGVINPASLENGCSYADFGLPSYCDRFELYDMARANAMKINELQSQPEPGPEPGPGPEPEPEPPTSE